MSDATRAEFSGATPPTVEQVRSGLGNLEPFIPTPIKALHEMPETRPGENGSFKFIMPYTRGTTGGSIENSFYVNSGAGDSIPGVKVGLREASHVTGWDYMNRRNTYEPQNSVDISVDFTGTDGDVLENAGKILAIPDAPSGYKVREGEDGRSMTSYYQGDVRNVQDAIKASLDRKGGNRFASKLVRELGNDKSIQVYVNIGGGAYTEIVYYDKVGA